MRLSKTLFLFLILGTSPLWAGSFYSLCLVRELGWWGAGLSAQLWGQERLTQQQPRDLATVKLLPWDRPFAGTHNRTADLLSDALIAGSVVPLYLAWEAWQEGFNSKALTQLVMLGELITLNSGINLWVRSYSFWPRPYLWSNSAPRSPAHEAYGAFYSGHASGAFAVAVFTAEWFSHEYPHSPYRGLMWVGSLGTASAIAALRVAAGKHFPSDVVVGALVGSALAELILWAHEDTKMAVTVHRQGLNLHYTF